MSKLLKKQVDSHNEIEIVTLVIILTTLDYSKKWSVFLFTLGLNRDI